MKKIIGILGYEYQLDVTNTLEEMNGNVGYIDLDRGIIQIASDAGFDMKVSTLLHEIMEAINYHLEAGLTEQQIKIMEVGLYQTLTLSKVNLSALFLQEWTPAYTGAN